MKTAVDLPLQGDGRRPIVASSKLLQRVYEVIVKN